MIETGLRNAIVYNPLALRNGLAVGAPSMLDFLRLLLSRYQALSTGANPLTPWHQAMQDNLPALALAEAYWSKLELLPHDRALHAAVVGPTQAGKSTIVNQLAGCSAATVSPLAGFTVQPQAFRIVDPAERPAAADLSGFFPGFSHYPLAALPRERFDCFGEATVEAAGHPLAGLVLWDTPDFDSINAFSYREGVLRTLALADVLVVVVSKEKYADQAVWDILAMLDPLAQPVLVVLNKLPAEGAELIADSLRKTWAAHRSDELDLLTLPYTAGGLREDATIAARLQAALQGALGKVSRRNYADRGLDLCRLYWSSWTYPVLVEQTQARTWTEFVDAAMDEAEELYRRDYLEHPHHYESFELALVELLSLLELPGIGGGIALARRALTWPFRQLGRLTRSNAKAGESPVAETALLRRLARHSLIGLAESILEQTEQTDAPLMWWRGLRGALRHSETGLLERFDAAVDAYATAFRVEIESTARSLYEALSTQPALLNALRAARATTDVFALALILKTGGIGVHDLLITPAALSLTSLLAESTAGHFLNRAAASLRERQRLAVRALLADALREGLCALPERIDLGSRLAIPEAALNRATQQLEPT